MASVTQCDHCKKVLEKYSKPIRVTVTVENGTSDEHTVYCDTSDACSKACFEGLVAKAVEAVKKARLT